MEMIGRMLNTDNKNRTYHRIVSRLFLVMLLMVSMTTVVYGDEEEVSLEVNTSHLQMGERTDLSMVLKNIGSAKLVTFEGIDHFEILSSGQSSSTQIINGTSTKITKASYTITPKEVGTFRLQATIQVDEGLLETNVIEMVVTEMDNALKDVDSEVFIRTSVSNETVYFGQPVVVTYDLYSIYQVEKFGFIEDLVVDGFIVEHNDEGKYEPNYLVINDTQFVKYKADQLLLYPIKPGSYTIDAFDFQANLGSGSMFSASKPEYLTSDPIQLNVLPLPEEGRPQDFNGLVGGLAIESSYNQVEVANGDPITLSVTISGSGNVSNITEIKNFGDFEGFTVYETEKDTKETISELGYNVSKEFELILIPKVSGRVEIESFDLPYFDSVTQSYSVLTIPGTSLQIGKALDDNGSQVNGDGQRLEPLMIKQINYAPSADDYFTLTVSKKSVFNTGIGLFFLTVLILGGLSLFKWHRRNNDPLRLMRNELKKAMDDEGLYQVMIRVYRHAYDVDLRSTTVAELESLLEDQDILVATKQLMFYMEHDKHYNQERFSEIKDISLEIIQRIIGF